MSIGLLNGDIKNTIMIQEDYVSFDTAKLLKEKGFNETCRAFWKEWNGEISLCDCNSSHTFDYCHNTMLENYNDSEETNIAAPTLQSAMKWIREEKHWYIQVSIQNDGTYIGYIYRTDGFPYVGWDKRRVKETPEEACEAAIKYCLQNLIQI